MKALVVILILALFAAGFYWLRKNPPKKGSVNGSNGMVPGTDKPQDKENEQQTT